MALPPPLVLCLFLSYLSLLLYLPVFRPPRNGARSRYYVSFSEMCVSVSVCGARACVCMCVYLCLCVFTLFSACFSHSFPLSPLMFPPQHSSSCALPFARRPTRPLQCAAWSALATALFPPRPGAQICARYPLTTPTAFCFLCLSLHPVCMLTHCSGWASSHVPTNNLFATAVVFWGGDRRGRASLYVHCERGFFSTLVADDGPGPIVQFISRTALAGVGDGGVRALGG